MAGDWLDEMFASIDAKDTEGFLHHLAEGARFRYGSQPPAVGIEAIRAAVDGFFSAIGSSCHHLGRRWHLADVAIVEGEVTYRRLDGREVTVPFCDVLHTRDGQVHDYRIYVDPAPLFAA
jgi:ketosteroid isomerase-like protein